MLEGNSFPTIPACNIQVSRLVHFYMTGCVFSCAAVYNHASTCTSSCTIHEEGCSIGTKIIQFPSCAILDIQDNSAIIINIVAAGQCRTVTVQCNFYITTVSSIDIAIDSASCFAAVDAYLSTFSYDSTIDINCTIQGAVLTADGYIAACTCIDCCIRTGNRSAAVQHYVAALSSNCGVTADFSITTDVNIIAFCINAFRFTLQRQFIRGADINFLISGAYCRASFNLNFGLFGELVAAVLLQDTVLFVFVICLAIAGNAGRRFGAFRLLSIRIGEARLQRTILQAAFTSFSIEGDVASLHCFAACGQAVSNLHIAGQVLLTVYEVAVGQLASQVVQHISYTVFVLHIDAGVVGDQGYYRAF